MRDVLKLALDALGKVTTEMLALKDELAERGARPTTNVSHQRLWDSSFKAYTDHALPAAIAIKEALAQPEQEPVAVYGYCPKCGAKGVQRERRPDGNDKCVNGHTYLSSKATPPKRPWGEPDANEIVRSKNT